MRGFFYFCGIKTYDYAETKMPAAGGDRHGKAITFYEEVIGDRVVMDFGENVQFSGGYALQEVNKWKEMIHTDEVCMKSNDAELYFEEKDFDKFLEYLKEFPEIQYVHPVEEAPWGQRVVRFYDPDFHIIEVGEPMDAVIKRLLDSGMTVEQVSEKSQYPIEYVKRFA